MGEIPNFEKPIHRYQEEDKSLPKNEISQGQKGITQKGKFPSFIVTKLSTSKSPMVYTVHEASKRALAFFFCSCLAVKKTVCTWGNICISRISGEGLDCLLKLRGKCLRRKDGYNTFCYFTPNFFCSTLSFFEALGEGLQTSGQPIQGTPPVFLCGRVREKTRNGSKSSRSLVFSFIAVKCPH